MNAILSDLQTEAARLSTKNLPPVGFDFRRRTKIERLLFLVAREICSRKFSYELRGLGQAHLKSFREAAEMQQYSEIEVGVVVEACRLSQVVCDLSSSDPYAREETLQLLGGTINSMLRNLQKMLESFILRADVVLSGN